MKKLGVGIIGLGQQGKIHLQNCLRLENVKVLGVADPSRAARTYANKMGVKNCYENYEDLLRSQGIDAVVISLPNFLHLESVMKAAEAGKHIFLEKPLARNVEEGKRILSLVNRFNMKLMVGYPLRFYPPLREIREKIVNGFFGEIEIAEGTNISCGPFASREDNMGGPVPVPSWWFDKELVGGGAMMDLGCHIVDYMAWYFGEADSARGFLGHKFNLELEDTAVGVVKFKSGPIALINVGWFSRAKMESISIHGTAEILHKIYSQWSIFEMVRYDVKKRLGLLVSTPFLTEIEHFVDCVQNDRRPSPSVEEALRDAEIIDLIYKNAVSLE